MAAAAGPALPGLALVRAPTLLIVGGLDDTVLDLNRAAQRQLWCENHLEIASVLERIVERCEIDRASAIRR